MLCVEYFFLMIVSSICIKHISSFLALSGIFMCWKWKTWTLRLAFIIKKIDIHTLSTSKHSNSNLSTTWWWLRFADGLSASLLCAWDDGFLKTSNKFRFFCCLRSLLVVCLESVDEVEAWSLLLRPIELVAPCKIDFTACTSRFNGDSFGFFTSAAIETDCISICLASLRCSGCCRHLLLVVRVKFSLDSISSTAYHTGHSHRNRIHFCTLNLVRYVDQMHVTNTSRNCNFIPIFSCTESFFRRLFCAGLNEWRFHELQCFSETSPECARSRMKNVKRCE